MIRSGGACLGCSLCDSGVQCTLDGFAVTSACLRGGLGTGVRPPRAVGCGRHEPRRERRTTTRVWAAPVRGPAGGRREVRRAGARLTAMVPSGRASRWPNAPGLASHRGAVRRTTRASQSTSGSRCGRPPRSAAPWAQPTSAVRRCLAPALARAFLRLPALSWLPGQAAKRAAVPKVAAAEARSMPGMVSGRRVCVLGPVGLVSGHRRDGARSCFR